MSAYLAVVAMRYQMLLQYRAAALAGFVTQFFWGAIKLMVLAAFLAASSREQPMSWAEIVAYVWLGQALLGLLPWNVDPEIQEKFTTGAVAYELLRPLDLYFFWYARTLAFRMATTTLRAMPMLVVALFVLPLVGLAEWQLAPPPSWASTVWFFASLAATVLLATACTMVMHISLYWTISGRGITVAAGGIVPVLCGLTVPLPLFPDWAQTFLYWQPLRGLADTPFRIYSGHIAPAEAAPEIALQLAWTVVIVLCGRALLRRAQRSLVVQGG
ncbi:MAG: ABC-2 family transporter protein [Pseudomonadota bacterium]